MGVSLVIRAAVRARTFPSSPAVRDRVFFGGKLFFTLGYYFGVGEEYYSKRDTTTDDPVCWPLGVVRDFERYPRTACSRRDSSRGRTLSSNEAERRGPPIRFSVGENRKRSRSFCRRMSR